jgi:hypothetical protein
MTDRYTCGDCGDVVELRKGYAGALELTCECDKTLGVKVSKKIPKEWSATHNSST